MATIKEYTTDPQKIDDHDHDHKYTMDPCQRNNISITKYKVDLQHGIPKRESTKCTIVIHRKLLTH